MFSLSKNPSIQYSCEAYNILEIDQTQTMQTLMQTIWTTKSSCKRPIPRDDQAYLADSRDPCLAFIISDRRIRGVGSCPGGRLPNRS